MPLAFRIKRFLSQGGYAARRHSLKTSLTNMPESQRHSAPKAAKPRATTPYYNAAYDNAARPKAGVSLSCTCLPAPASCPCLLSLARSFPPRRWRWFFRRTIDWMLLQQSHPFLNRAFELWISTSNYILGPVLDIDVGRDAFVLNCPMSIACEEASARLRSSSHRR
jgi:hypothetical protein